MGTLLCGVMLGVSVALAVMFAVSGNLIPACIWSGASGLWFSSFVVSLHR